MRRFGGLPEVLRPSEVAWVRRIHVGTREHCAGGTKQAGFSPWPVPGVGHRRYAHGDAPALLGEGDAGGDQAGAVYARVRTGKQAEAGNLERQRWRLMEYAARKGYRVVLQARDVAAARLGFPYLEMRCDVLGVPAVVTADQEPP